ncbi:PLP-dependent decarboxylase [Methylophaga frappieri]|uniref:PLP-dependent decarboxylase n=1 Tax=Methylophaga frappieri (strain ATCC BAA-2434 / DSM 25690 / JAM7) TaxID=754477 RepID=I1YJ29_METFJ|nr:pyridoxal-dependent decarboxylase [Methylophaga frappieri]AFJ02922.1 PLP-dependent decarboxylase [Methylophaga frappieri]
MSQTSANFTEILAQLALTLPAELQSQCLDLLNEATQYSGTYSAAHMRGHLYPAALAGQILAGLHQGNLLSPSLSPKLAQAEQEVKTQLCRLFHFPDMHFTPGGSYSNVEALSMAKQRYPNRHWVYAGQDAHYSVAKACQTLGLSLQLFPDDFSLWQQACEVPPVAMIQTFGTTSSGQISPSFELTTLMPDKDFWWHIDAAWGGFKAFLVDPQLKQLSALADSLCFDPHKALGQPRPCGTLFYRQPLAPLPIQADYLCAQPDSRLPGSYGAEYFLPLWLTLKQHGLQQIQTDLKKNLHNARVLHDWLTQRGVKVLDSPTALVCFQTSVDLQALVQTGIISATLINQQLWYRLVFADRTCQASAVINQLAAYL